MSADVSLLLWWSNTLAKLPGLHWLKAPVRAEWGWRIFNKQSHTSTAANQSTPKLYKFPTSANTRNTYTHTNRQRQQTDAHKLHTTQVSVGEFASTLERQWDLSLEALNLSAFQRHFKGRDDIIFPTP